MDKFDLGMMPPIMQIADVSFVKRKYLDIPYASVTPTQKLDIYLPDDGEGPFPVMFHIHGGGFMIGDKRDGPFVKWIDCIKHGFALVSANYRLSGEAIFPAAVQDIKAVIRWVRANQSKYHLDGNRIAAFGGSAGGNLAAMLGATGNIRDFDDPTLGNANFSSAIQAVVDMFGPIDFLTMDEQARKNGIGLSDHCEPRSPESSYLGGPILKKVELAKKANPTTYIHSGMPPFFIQHGNRDELVPCQQSIDFANAILEKAPSSLAHFELLEGAGHGDPMFETDQNLSKVLEFAKKALAGQ